MQTLHALNISVHVLFGTAALLIGLVAVWTNQQLIAHRRYGRLFLLTLTVVVGSAGIGVLLFRPNPVLIILSLLSGYVGYSGYRVIQLRGRRPSFTDWLLALVVLLLGAGYGLAARHTPGWSPAVIYSTLAALLLVTSYDLVKYGWLFDRLKGGWIYEHIYKMLSAYNAILSAFAGTVFPHHKPYSQLGPTFLFLGALSYFILRQNRRKRGNPVKTLSLLLLLLTGPTYAFAQLKIGSQVLNFTLSNQFNQSTTIRFPASKMTLLAFADRSGNKLLKEWVIRLSPDQTLHVVTVACTGWVPFFMKDQVRKAFLAQKPILLDWNNAVANQFGFDKTGCLLVQIDQTGRVMAIGKGAATPSEIASFRKSTPP